MYDATLDRATADFLTRWAAPAPASTPWRLASGTGLALQIQHRRSADLVWFVYDSPVGLIEEVDRLLTDNCATVTIDHRDARTLRGTVDGVRTSWFVVRGQWLDPPVRLPALAGVSLAGLRDLAAAKFVAIGQRGTRRGFVDRHVLFDGLQWDLDDLIAAVVEKFPGQRLNLVHYLKAMTHFAAAEAEPMPQMLTRLSWSDVRRAIVRRAMERRVRSYMRRMGSR